MTSALRKGRSSAEAPDAPPSAARSRRVRHSPQAARSIPTASQARYPAPAYFTIPNSTAFAWSSEATPAADSVISTASPHHTPAAARYAVRAPRRAATEITYSELGPGSRTIRTRPTR